MRRAAALIALAFLVEARPAEAMVIHEMSDRMPLPGHFELETLGSYASYDLTVIDGTVFATNPTSSSYRDISLATALEMGVAPDTSVSLQVPASMLRKFDNSAPTEGLGDVDLGFARRAYDNGWFSWKSRILAELPTGSNTVGGGISALGLDNIFKFDLFHKALTLTTNANYLYRLRSTEVDPATNLFITSWPGQRAEMNFGLEWHASPTFSMIAELLSHWDSNQEANRQGVPNTGDTCVGIAPGFTWTLSPHVSWLGSVSFPLLRGGYQASYRIGGTTGLVMPF